MSNPGTGTIDNTSEDTDMVLLRDGCDAGVISDEWTAAYERRKPFILRICKRYGVDVSDDGGLLPRQSVRFAASWALSN